MNDDTRDSADDSATLLGAYVLNALSIEERAAFEAHLAESETLRHETTELADTAVLLGGAIAPVQPSAALKANIMGLIATTPQLPPLSGPVAVEPDAAATVTPLVAVPAPAQATPAQTAPALTPAGQKAQSRWFTRPAVALVSAAAVLGLILGGGVLVNTIGESQTQQLAADQLAAINASRDMQQAVAEVEGGGTATLVWSNELASSAMIVDGLPALPSDKVYELWYIDTESVARPAGTFGVGENGATWRVLEGEMHSGDTVGVTVEPSGGSDTPTTAPIVAIASA
ncbi:anti-sigma factor domain-containing protein [Conyzicola sp.]|uniref:anti-sigma factor n=1 Tax=Conyzicola sp. TaxID=1969404 RepID=UPI00398932F4